MRGEEAAEIPAPITKHRRTRAQHSQHISSDSDSESGDCSFSAVDCAADILSCVALCAPTSLQAGAMAGGVVEDYSIASPSYSGSSALAGLQFAKSINERATECHQPSGS